MITKKFTRVKCTICATWIRHAKDGYKLDGSPAHRDCRRMQTKGLFSGAYTPKTTNSTGKPCTGCLSVIDTAHAHRNGEPFHKECLI